MHYRVARVLVRTVDLLYYLACIIKIAFFMAANKLSKTVKTAVMYLADGV